MEQNEAGAATLFPKDRSELVLQLSSLIPLRCPLFTLQPKKVASKDYEAPIACPSHTVNKRFQESYLKMISRTSTSRVLSNTNRQAMLLSDTTSRFNARSKLQSFQLLKTPQSEDEQRNQLSSQTEEMSSKDESNGSGHVPRIEMLRKQTEEQQEKLRAYLKCEFSLLFK